MTSFVEHERAAARYLTLAAVTAEPEPHITYLREAATQLNEAQLGLVAELRDLGWSWAKIGAHFGVTKQTAWSRWGGGL